MARPKVRVTFKDINSKTVIINIKNIYLRKVDNSDFHVCAKDKNEYWSIDEQTYQELRISFNNIKVKSK